MERKTKDGKQKITKKTKQTNHTREPVQPPATSSTSTSERKFKLTLTTVHDLI